MQQQEPDIPAGYLRVTEVLTPYINLSHIDPAVLANAADRGTRTHAYCESYALGLFVADVDDDCKNYFDVFCDWFDSAVKEVLYTEKRLNSPKYRISGAFDMIAVLRGDNEPSLIDIKTPASPSSSWQLQTAAYQMLARDILGIDVSRRLCLMLPRVKSEASVVEYRDHERDQQLYLNALELYRFFRG